MPLRALHLGLRLWRTFSAPNDSVGADSQVETPPERCEFLALRYTGPFMTKFQIIEKGAADSAEKRELLERVKIAIEEAKLDSEPATLAVVGIESLHIIGNLYGPALTHEILRTVASLFESEDRKGATWGWVEDSRIVFVFSKCALESAVALSELVIRRVADVEMRAGKHRLKLAPHIGLAHTQHDKNYSFETLMQVAEEGVEIASSSEGGSAVHTELYEIVQPKAGPRKTRPRVVAAPVVRETPNGAPAAKAKPFGVANRAPVAAEPQQPAVVRPSQVRGPVETTPEAPVTQESADSNLAAGRVHDSMLEHMLREMFSLYEDRGPVTGELRERVIGAVRRWSEESRNSLGRELHAQQETELDQLRRRLAKMTERVEVTEGELEVLRATREDYSGIESAFRAVQGISSDDADYKLKSGLMEQILQANLELMRLIN